MHNDDLGKSTRPSDVRYFMASWLNSAYIIEKLFPCTESRNSYQRLFKLTQLLSNSLPAEKRNQKLKILGNAKLLKLAEHYSTILKESSQQQRLGETFAKLQEKDFSNLPVAA